MVTLSTLEVIAKIAEIETMSHKGDSYHPNLQLDFKGADASCSPTDFTRLPEIRKQQSFLYMIKKQLEPAKEVQYGRQ